MSIFSQIAACAILAIISLCIEIYCQNDLVSKFLAANGLLLITALFALNASSAYHVVSRLAEIEKEHNAPYGLDKEKISVLYAFYEQLILLGVFYILMSIMPECKWKISVIYDSSHTDSSLFSKIQFEYASIALLARICIFQTVYGTLDFARAAIHCMLNPDRRKDSSS